ncbi:hypothetical protein V6N11_016592 [Hibiscus sabdariffa]|uniref:Uncharacterized protein n=1 Tax=Hibiscus sabdariffa TaxID=183260 RepID=A0ABR2TVV3_9ROSI
MDHAKCLVAALLLPMIVSFVLLSNGCREIQTAGKIAIQTAIETMIRSESFNNVMERLKRFKSRVFLLISDPECLLVTRLQPRR